MTDKTFKLNTGQEIPALGLGRLPIYLLIHNYHLTYLTLTPPCSPNYTNLPYMPSLTHLRLHSPFILPAPVIIIIIIIVVVISLFIYHHVTFSTFYSLKSKRAIQPTSLPTYLPTYIPKLQTSETLDYSLTHSLTYLLTHTHTLSLSLSLLSFLPPYISIPHRHTHKPYVNPSNHKK